MPLMQQKTNNKTVRFTKKYSLWTLDLDHVLNLQRLVGLRDFLDKIKNAFLINPLKYYISETKRLIKCLPVLSPP